MEKVRVRNVEFGYNGVKVLRNVSLRIDTGHVVSLLGPNGSGKTTLLKVLLGLYRPERGEVSLEGRPMREMTPRELARKIAYVPQTHNMSFAYSVMDVVLMGRAPYMSFFSRYSREDKEIALHALERLSITNLKDRVYTELSGGERQLVLIGRALTQGADTLVMDEPLNGLDYGNQIRLLECIAGLAQEGYTFIKTTHFPDHALWVSSRVVLLRRGEIVADGPTDSVVNEMSISDLYKRDIAILDVGNGVRTCLPRSLLGRQNGHNGSHLIQDCEASRECLM